MNTDLPLKCRCGAVQGVVHDVSPSTVNRIVCYCDDCQAFARWLGGEGEILDPHGGTDISQLSPATLELTAGREHLACVRLSPKGLVRWYAACCRTPVGNGLATRRPPFVGLIAPFVDHAADGRPRDEVMGPPQRVHLRFARGDRASLGEDRFPLDAIARSVRLMARWWLRGDAKRSPLFDEAGALRVTPEVMSPGARQRLTPAADPPQSG
jgi:hypothetical protein